MRKLLFGILFILPFAGFSQYTIHGQFSDHTMQSVYIAEIVGDKIFTIDSTVSNPTGHFDFRFSDMHPVGMYRIYSKKGGYLDVIFNKEDVIFSSRADKPADHVKFQTSFENKIYYDYLNKKNYDQYRLELLQPVVSYYPIGDPFYPDLKNEFMQIQENLDQYVQGIVMNYPDAFATRLLKLDRRPIIDGTMSPGAQKEFLKKHFFKGKSINDPTLLRTNAVTGAILTYLSLFQDSQLSKNELEQEFMYAVDTIMAHAKENTQMNEFVAEYLISGFEQFGFYKVMTHVAENIVIDENCENPELEQRVEILRKMVAGKKAPNIISKTINNVDFDLSKIESEYTLIVFWSTQCPHCEALLPELHDFYNSYKDQIEIIAVSIDTSKDALNAYLSSNNYSWTTICDYKGWDGDAAIAYGIYTTPNMFLLDREKKIVGHPADIKEVINLIK